MVMLDSYEKIVRSKRFWLLFVWIVIPLTLYCVTIQPFALIVVGFETLIGTGWFLYIAEEEAIFDAYY